MVKGAEPAALATAEALIGNTQSALVDEPPLNAKKGGFIRKGYDSSLDELIDLAENSRACVSLFGCAAAEKAVRERVSKHARLRHLEIGVNFRLLNAYNVRIFGRKEVGDSGVEHGGRRGGGRGRR